MLVVRRLCKFPMFSFFQKYEYRVPLNPMKWLSQISEIHNQRENHNKILVKISQPEISLH